MQRTILEVTYEIQSTSLTSTEALTEEIRQQRQKYPNADLENSQQKINELHREVEASKSELEAAENLSATLKQKSCDIQKGDTIEVPRVKYSC